MEALVEAVNVFHKECHGPKRFKRDIMVIFSEKIQDGIDFHDFFLTTDQANDLIRDLQSKINLNKEIDEEG